MISKKLLTVYTFIFAVLCSHAAEPKEVALFNGRDLQGWSVIDFGGQGEVGVSPAGTLEIGMGESLTGMVYTNKHLAMNYEIELEARRTLGSDFFVGLTFPVATNSCTLVVGGWGGGVVGVSSINYLDASENETSTYHRFEPQEWYRVRLRVTPNRIQAWLGDEVVVNFDSTDARLGMRAGSIEQTLPLGISTWQTAAEYRKLIQRPVDGPVKLPLIGEE